VSDVREGYWKYLPEEELTRLLAEGMSYGKVAKQLGSTMYAVRRKAFSLKLKSMHPVSLDAAKEFWSEERLGLLRKLVRGRKASWPESAYALGCSETTVWKQAKLLGLRKENVHRAGRFKWTPEEDARLIELVGDVPFLSISRSQEIAKEMGRGTTGRGVEQRFLMLVKRMRQSRPVTKYDIPPLAQREQQQLKQRPCIGALCTEAGAERFLSRPGQWLCDRCIVYTRGVHAGGV
jgi:hypothetical protein